MAKKKKVNPNVRNTIVQARLNATELHVVHKKAFTYCKGSMSKFVRMALLNYKPAIKKEGEK